MYWALKNKKTCPCLDASKNVKDQFACSDYYENNNLYILLEPEQLKLNLYEKTKHNLFYSQSNLSDLADLRHRLDKTSAIFSHSDSSNSTASQSIGMISNRSLYCRANVFFFSRKNLIKQIHAQ